MHKEIHVHEYKSTCKCMYIVHANTVYLCMIETGYKQNNELFHMPKSQN